MEFGQKADALFQAGEDGQLAVERVLAEEQVEHRVILPAVAVVVVVVVVVMMTMMMMTMVM